MSYYNTYLRPFLRGICRDRLEIYVGKKALTITLKDLDDDVLNKYLHLILSMKEEGFLDIDTDKIVTNFEIWLRSGSQEDSNIIVESIRDAYLEKFEPIMQKFLDEEMECEVMEQESDKRYEQGFTTTMDKETGETSWKRPIYAHIAQN